VEYKNLMFFPCDLLFTTMSRNASVMTITMVITQGPLMVITQGPLVQGLLKIKDTHRDRVLR